MYLFVAIYCIWNTFDQVWQRNQQPVYWLSHSITNLNSLFFHYDLSITIAITNAAAATSAATCSISVYQLCCVYTTATHPACLRKVTSHALGVSPPDLEGAPGVEAGLSTLSLWVHDVAESLQVLWLVISTQRVWIVKKQAGWRLKLLPAVTCGYPASQVTDGMSTAA